MGLISAGALSLVPKIHRDRVPVAAPLGGGISFAGFGGHRTAAGQLAQMETYGNVAWLFATVNRIAQATASAEWQLFEKMPNGDREEIFEHPLLDLWNNASPFETGEGFREAGQQHLDLTGEWWTVMVANRQGLPVELQLVRPDRMRPVPDPDAFVSGYVYKIGSMEIRLAPEDVLFLKMPNPLDPYRGLGPIQSLMADLDVERMSALWQGNSMRNGAHPGGIIEFDDTISDPDFEKLVARWQQQHQGVANANRVAILERGKWVETKITARDMMQEQLRKLNRDIILGAFGMPLPMLGITDSVNRANAEAAEVMFGQWVIRPRLDRIRAMLNSQLIPRYMARVERLRSRVNPLVAGDIVQLRSADLEFDYVDPTPTNREFDLREAVEGFNAGLLTRDEARMRIGEGAMEDGSGDELKPSNPNPFTLGISSNPLARVKANDPLLPSPVEEQEALIARNWQRRLTAEANALAEHAAGFMTELSAQGSGVFRNAKVSTTRTKIEPTDFDAYDWDWWSRYGDEVTEEIYQATLRSILAAEPALQVNIAQQIAAAYAEHRGAQLLRLDGEVNVITFTRDRVNDLVAKTIRDGDSLRTLQAALRDDFAFSRSRAATVARTETATALGQGVKQASIAQGRDEKHWVTQGDGVVDSPLCELNAAQGWIPAQDAFQSGHDTIPAHPNCRCVVRYRNSSDAELDIDIFEDDAEDIAAREQVIADNIQRAYCPKGHQLPVSGFQGMAQVYCRNCKEAYTIDTRRHDVAKRTRQLVERDADGAIVAVTTEELNG